MKAITGFFEEFKKFIMRGSVMDMAVGVIVGGAFTSIVTSLNKDILTSNVAIRDNSGKLLHIYYYCAAVPDSLTDEEKSYIFKNMLEKGNKEKIIKHFSYIKVRVFIVSDFFMHLYLY